MIKNDEYYIRLCFELALKAKGEVSPNPLVGSVIIKDDAIISTGYHKKSGTPHAELDAINNAQESLVGSTLYCNLEPCCHLNKKTPPCAQRIIEEGISKVVISNLDPNPDVAGRGVKLLEAAGIKVIVGILEEEGAKLNEIFFYHILHKRPFIHLKIAQTLDGKTATQTGDSKWITNELSRQNVHLQRELYDAILIGANTARLDNPSLTVRISGKVKGLKRIILSRTGEISKELNLFSDQFSKDTYLVLPRGTKTDITKNVLFVSSNLCGDIDLAQLMNDLYNELKITSIYVEGGSSIHTQFLKEKLFNRLSFYTAPKIIGTGQESVGNLGINKMDQAIILDKLETYSFDGDQLITGIRK